MMENTITFEERDEYWRKPIAEKIIRLIKSEIDISPMVIDGNWGAGKTEFTFKLINLMKASGSSYTTVYIDAFQADHADEPLLSILAPMLEVLPESESSIKKKAVPAIKFGIKAILKGGVSWVLRQDAAEALDDFDKEIQKACDNAIDKSINSLIDEHQQIDSKLQLLKVAINEATKDKPLVIFIDELDRCKPDFAIEMLEKIKHVFDVPNIHFVLIANKEQLRAAINHCYGQNINSQKYLDKFLKYSFTLPDSRQARNSSLSHYAVQHFFNLVEQSSVLNNSKIDSFQYEEFIQALFQENYISLREAETFVRHLEIIHSLTNGLNNPSIGVFLLRLMGVFIFCFKPGLRQQVENMKYDAIKLNSLLGVRKFENIATTRHWTRVDVISNLIFMESPENGFGSNKNFGLSSVAVNAIQTEIETYFQGSLFFGNNGRIQVISQTISKLKLVE